MATPEMKIPSEPLEISPKSEDSTVGVKDVYKAFQAQESSISSPQIRDVPIIYRYLTFETELPSPTSLGPAQNGSAVPQQPDLRNYVSPFTWSPSRKTFTTWLSCAVTVVTAYTAGSYSPPSQQMSEYWGVSQIAIYVGITTFTTGFAVAPMVLAPFSELNGRKPVFIATGILFVICQLCCAVTRSYPGMLLARFFAGVGGVRTFRSWSFLFGSGTGNPFAPGNWLSTFSTMVGGVVSDIYHTEDRNTPMALFSGAALFGTGLGPLCSGFIAQHLSWRWVFYVQVIDCGLLILAVTIFFKETRGSVLLSKRAKLLNTWYEAREKVGLVGFEMILDGGGKKQSQRIRWKVKSDEERQNLAKMIGISIYRPFHLLLTEVRTIRRRSSPIGIEVALQGMFREQEDLLLPRPVSQLHYLPRISNADSEKPVVFFFSLWVAFSWAVLYLTFSAIPLVFTKNHNFDTQENGAVFAAMCVGSILSTILSIYQEKVARHYGKMSSTPEGRLYFACIESALLPIGLFWFGWTSFPSVPWIVPTIAVTCATMGIFSIYLAVFNYLADTYHRYASSALAAQSFCRNMLGGIFPLVTTAMFNHMSFAGASSFLGGVGALLTVVPWVLVFYGPKIRARSKFASEIMD